MKTGLYLIFIAILASLTMFLATLVLKNNVERKPKLTFGNTNMILTMDKTATTPNTNKANANDPDNEIKDKVVRQQLEVAWGQWNADIFNYLFRDHHDPAGYYCPGGNIAYLNFIVSKGKQIKDIDVKSNCNSFKNYMTRSIKEMENEPILEFPSLSRKEFQEYNVSVYDCNIYSDPNCGERARPEDFPEVERYTKEVKVD